ncbi:hypothetical protein SD51_01350 [Alicyclobacillus tengchongensis]|nr:hypothetical protein SD51_01350 [Alicyclobacillus tengchongensis]
MKRTRRFGSWAIGCAIIATILAAGAGMASADTTGSSTADTNGISSSGAGSEAGGQSPMGSDVLGQTVATPSVIDVSNTYPTIGERVTYSASGLVPKQTYRVLWEAFQGTWDVDGNTFVGESYTPFVKVLGTVTADANGEVHGVLRVPTGYGDIHQIGLADASGIVAAQGSVTVKPSFTISRTRESEGSFFTIRVQGIGYGAYSSAYEVLYDNHLMGNIAAVTTNGTAVFQVRAEGIGSHLIEIAPCSIGSPYLNEQQSPYNWKPTFSIPVTVTKGHPVDVKDSIPASSISTGNHLIASPGHGIVGSTFTLTGQGLPANESLTLEWSNTVGNHVTAAGYHSAQTVLGHVTTSSTGTFTVKIPVPVNVGGPPHTIQAVDPAGTIVGTTTYQIYPSLVSAPNVVKAGQVFTIHLQGGGPDTYDNCYSVLYDNSSIGYACGFNTNGDMQIQIRATGGPGVHYIDLYPTIQQGNQKVPNLYVLPLLTYKLDHPGEAQPAFHLVIDVQS